MQAFTLWVEILRMPWSPEFIEIEWPRGIIGLIVILFIFFGFLWVRKHGLEDMANDPCRCFPQSSWAGYVHRRMWQASSR